MAGGVERWFSRHVAPKVRDAIEGAKNLERSFWRDVIPPAPANYENPLAVGEPEKADPALEAFADVVSEVIDGLPSPVIAMLDNVAIVVENRNPDEPLLGQYSGIDLTRRGHYYSGELPDKITIYRDNHLTSFRDPIEFRRQVEVTVKHEIAHYFGITHERMHELGLN